MKNLLLTVLSLGPLVAFVPASSGPPAPKVSRVAQAASPTDTTTVRLLFGADAPELTEVLARVLEVEKHRLQFQDIRLAGRVLHLTYQEFRQGKAGPETELVGQPDQDISRFDSLGRLTFTVYARQYSASAVENRFLFPRVMLRREFRAARSHAARYSLRPDIHREYRAADQTGRPANNPATEIHLPIGPKVPLLVYTPPYEADGMLLYCSLAQSQVPLADWYRRFRIPHFVVYYAQLQPAPKP